MESQLFLIIALLFLVTCSYGTFLESTVDIEVTGDDTVISGVRQYTLFGNSSTLEVINFTVHIDTGKAKEVTILKNGKRIHVDGGRYMTFTDQEQVGKRMIYTCGVIFDIENESFTTRYFVDKEVEVVTNEMTYLIASNVGSTVYAGEEISIFCGGHNSEIEEYLDVSFDDYGKLMPDFEEECEVSLIGNPSSTIEIFGVDPINVTCDLRQFGQVLEDSYSAQSSCSRNIYLTLNVSSKLNVSLHPLYFDRDSTNLTFVCTSDPPRLMNWMVLNTNNENIMDIHKPFSREAIVNVSITQKPGNTILVIQIDEKNAKSDNGIETVICSTYDTKAHVIKTAQRRVHENHNRESAAVANPKVGALSLTLVTILSVVIAVLVLVVIFLFTRMKQINVPISQSPDDFPNGDDGVNEDDETALAEIVLHDNTMYLSYEERDETQQKDVPCLPSSADCNDKDGEGNDEAPNETDLQDNPTYQPYTGTDESL